MFKNAAAVLAWSSVALGAASAAPAWYPRECAAIDYCANVEHVAWVLPAEGRAPQVNIRSVHGTATIQRAFIVRTSQDKHMHVCMRFDPFGALEVTCLLMPAIGH